MQKHFFFHQRRISLFSIILFFFFSLAAFATHNRAGEITYRCVEGLKYEITITTYTKTSSLSADRPELDSVHWGDNTQSLFTRGSKTDLANDISVNIYKEFHTYGGNGVYIIHLEDPNRNQGIVNIPGSVDVPFYIETQLVINQSHGCNNSPVLNIPPIREGCLGVPFIHNPNATDIDGDSLSFELIACKGAGGGDCNLYSFPSSYTTNTFTLDPVTGDMLWNSPNTLGEFNVAFKVHQFRNGQPYGYVERDMQITILACSNHPPQIAALTDTCVLAGGNINFNISASDPDSDIVSLYAFGDVFHLPVDSALFSMTPGRIAIGNFTWTTNCSHIRNQPYRVEFEASDNDDTVTLVDLKGLFIRVISPPPTNLTATALGNAIILNWGMSSCPQANGYNIYRRNGLYPDTIQCPCETGAPAFTGYTYVGKTRSIDSTFFNDNNGGAGLAIGIDYCYIVTATFPDGSESCASNQACAKLKKDLPVITNASVRNTDATNGSIYIAWSAPVPPEFDTSQFRQPYQYKVFHSPDFYGTNFSTSPIFILNDINDTIVIDTLIDTDTHSWSYKIEFYYTDSGNLKLKGSTSIASSVFLTLAPTDNAVNLSWEEHVPWANHRYDIFSKNSSGVYDSIATTTEQTYKDTGLDNGFSQCYFVKSVGSYFTAGILDTLINLSEKECGTPVDNVAPCPPVLNVIPDCIALEDGLIWTNPNHTCANDVMLYNIYYSPDSSSNFELLQTINDANDTTLVLSSLESLTGCFKVEAVDTAGNKSVSDLFCVDTCRQYVLPSVFTPNNDNSNDIYHACDETTSPALQAKNCPPYKNVKDVDMKIFNRWGNLVFSTTDKNINWDGKDEKSKQECSAGVYYYSCKVNFFRLHGIQTVELHGYIHLIRK